MDPLELESITITGFKSIRTIDSLKLRAINVLIGANGSGKSNFIGVFSFLHEIREGRLNAYSRKSGGANQILHFGSKTTKEISIHISFRDSINQYKIVLGPSDDDALIPLVEDVYFWDKSLYKVPYGQRLQSRESGLEAGISDSTTRRVADWVRSRLGRWRLYHVHDTSSSSPLRSTSQLNDNRFLRPDGGNLAAFLYMLKNKEAYFPNYQLIRKTIQQIAPFFDDFILEPDLLNQEIIRLAWRHRESDQFFSVASFSDGTLRFIQLTTLFLQPKELRPSVIIVDEPELGLHPAAVTLLASLVRSVSNETQIILSTQSALLLDHFAPEDVLVAERVGGATTVTRLESDNLKDWLVDYSLGQLWEKNLFGGRPKEKK